MNYELKFLLSIFLPFFLFGCSGSDKFVKVVTDEGIHQFKVEVVTAEEDKRQGLMGRESLKEDGGMLFVYEKEEQQSFWMKNMMISLDILFIGSDLVINHISENVPPCISDDCINYSSPKPSQYVLELNAGIAEELDIEVGDRIVLP